MSDTLRVRTLERDDIPELSGSFEAVGWTRPPLLFHRYLDELNEGRRWVAVAELNGMLAGYVTLCWEAVDPVLRGSAVPEIVDLNVLPDSRGRGVGSALVAAAEAQAGTQSRVVGLRVGLHAGYGAAQRLYVLRGYVPDGAGTVIEGHPVEEGATIRLDDRPTLRMTRDLDR